MQTFLWQGGLWSVTTPWPFIFSYLLIYAFLQSKEFTFLKLNTRIMSFNVLEFSATFRWNLTVIFARRVTPCRVSFIFVSSIFVLVPGSRNWMLWTFWWDMGRKSEWNLEWSFRNATQVFINFSFEGGGHLFQFWNIFFFLIDKNMPLLL